MIFNMKFNPLLFQVALAAGGVALMPFNFLQYAIPHDKGLVKFSDIIWTNLTAVQSVLYAILVAIMIVSVIIHFALTTIFVKGLIKWVSNKMDTNDFLNDPYKNVTIFAIVASLSMTANVFWAPVGFFIPSISNNLQALMWPSLVYFGILWFSLFALELRVIKGWFKSSVDSSKYSFVWLLDIFAFGLVSLTGSGVVVMSMNTRISELAAIGTLFTLTVGLFLLVLKLIHLITSQVKAGKLPEAPILPAYFLVVPIICLFGLSLFRLTSFLEKYLLIDLSGLSFFIMNISYVITVVWVILTMYLLGDYLKNQFIASHYSPPQWSMVWALVGSQVLGVYVQGLYIQNTFIAVINYTSIIVAISLYLFILKKFFKMVVG